MTKEEAKEYLTDISYALGNMSVEYLTEKDGERMREAIDTLEKGPQGYWIRVDKDKLICSECDVIHFIAQYPHGKIDWCPNCGTKMHKPHDRRKCITA